MSRASKLLEATERFGKNDLGKTGITDPSEKALVELAIKAFGTVNDTLVNKVKGADKTRVKKAMAWLGTNMSRNKGRILHSQNYGHLLDIL